MSKNWLLLKILQNSLKYGTDLNANATSGNTRMTHILELHTLAWKCPSKNYIPNINKKNIKRKEAVVFWYVCSWLLVCTQAIHTFFTYTRFSFFFLGLGFDPFNSGFYCRKFDFPLNLLTLLVNIWILYLYPRINKD